MWQWTLNWSEVRGDIVVGSCPVGPGDLDRIRDEAGATAVLSLQTDECRAWLGVDAGALAARAAALGLVVVASPMRDFDADDQRARLPGAVRALEGLVAAGHRTYVHCTAGVNRAPLVVLGYLTFVESMAVDDALALIQRARPEAAPYREVYDACCGDVRGGATADPPPAAAP